MSIELGELVEPGEKIKDGCTVHEVLYINTDAMRKILDRMEENRPGRKETPIIITIHTHKNKRRIIFTHPSKGKTNKKFEEEAEEYFSSHKMSEDEQ